MEELSNSWQILSGSNAGPVIEFTFCGVHNWTHGIQMQQYIETVLAGERPTGIVINLLGYHYEFGNDLFGLFTVGFDRVAKQVRPICVVAGGQTLTSLESLLKASHVRDAVDVTFATTSAEVTEWLNKGRKSEPR